MNPQEFFQKLDAQIARFDLLCHPFYKAWAAGELSRADLQEYSRQYYHHIRAFPTYLAEFAMRLDEGALRQAVLSNMADELGQTTASGEREPSHADLWLDFAEAMGVETIGRWRPIAEIQNLIECFHRVAAEGTAEEVLAAFYTYESEVPKVADAKATGLREMYGADEKTCAYFTLHSKADVHHSRVWRQQLEARLQTNPAEAESALLASEAAAKSLWSALDGVENRRMALA